MAEGISLVVGIVGAEVEGISLVVGAVGAEIGGTMVASISVTTIDVSGFAMSGNISMAAATIEPIHPMTATNTVTVAHSFGVTLPSGIITSLSYC